MNQAVSGVAHHLHPVGVGALVPRLEVDPRDRPLRWRRLHHGARPVAKRLKEKYRVMTVFDDDAERARPEPRRGARTPSPETEQLLRPALARIIGELGPARCRCRPRR